MLALVKRQQGAGHVELIDVPEPKPGPGEVKIRVEEAGICGTDLHMLHGQAFAFAPPVTLGHEFGGVIEAVGAGVTMWQVGDRVTSEPPVQTCGVCEYCRLGLPALCSDRRSLGSGVNGAFARYVVAPVHRLHRLPPQVDFVSAALVEPAACCVHAVIEQGSVLAGDTVLVTGPGPIGLLAAQVAKAQGARVLLVGTPDDAERLRIGREVGVDATFTTQQGAIQDIARDFSGGLGVNVVLECSGAQPAVRAGMDALKKRGHYVQIGLLSRPIEVDVGLFVTKELLVTGSFGSTYTSWERALGLIAQGRIHTHPLVTDHLPLSRWEEGFAKMERKQGCKIVLQLGEA